MHLADLTDVFGLFGVGIGCGVALLTIFFIFGSAIAFLFGIISRG